VTRLQGAGMLASRSIGRAKMVRASTESRLAKPLSELLLLTFGPRLVVDEEFSGISGLQGLLLYGSWSTPQFARLTNGPAIPMRWWFR